jgi:hypothetical protein
VPRCWNSFSGSSDAEPSGLTDRIALSSSDLATKVIPQFERHPLLSSNRKDFEKFAAIVQLMHEGAHLQPDGFAVIVQLAASLNASSKKRFDRTAIASEMNV